MQTGEHMVYDSVYMKLKNRKTVVTECRSVFCQGIGVQKIQEGTYQDNGNVLMLFVLHKNIGIFFKTY